MIGINNKWLSIFIAKVQIIVPSMTDVTKLRRQNIMIYGVKKHEEGYLVTIDLRCVAKQLEAQYPIALELSIYPSILKIMLPDCYFNFFVNDINESVHYRLSDRWKFKSSSRKTRARDINRTTFSKNTTFSFFER